LQLLGRKAQPHQARLKGHVPLLVLLQALLQLVPHGALRLAIRCNPLSAAAARGSVQAGDAAAVAGAVWGLGTPLPSCLQLDGIALQLRQGLPVAAEDLQGVLLVGAQLCCVAGALLEQLQH
jgi:hypothetical protein